MNAIPLINVAPPKRDNEKQLRQEVNTSLVALKREAFNLETLINQAAQTLVEVNERITALENVQGDYVKKTDVTDTIESGNMNPVTSNAVATSNAMPVDTVTNGNMHSVTSNAVYDKTFAIEKIMAFRLIIASPNNVVTYVKIKMPNYNKSTECPLVLCQVWTTLFGLTEGSVAKILYGGRYGIKGISWTIYTADNDNFFWLQITSYRNLCLISTHQMHIEARTTTAPSGVTFTAPV